MNYPKRLSLLFLLVAWHFVLTSPAAAHPAPFSYLDLHLDDERIEGSLTVHTIDVAHELGIEEPTTLLDESVLTEQYSAIKAVLAPAIALAGDGGERLSVVFTGIEPLPEDSALRLSFRATGPPPAALTVDTGLFRYDPTHQTFVNIYEGEALQQQFLFDGSSGPKTHYAGTAAGVLAVFATFVPSGAHHVLIGPDHILFIVGLILLGGSLRRLALIVTCFTLGHSVTLALAALDIFAPPARLIEPLIALTIVVVGADNLMRKKGERDLRPWFAGLFGLIHGFGFAFVLREFGLPQANLAWALLSFNLGVEIGQLVVVIPLALALAFVGRRFPRVLRPLVTMGSLAVIGAGAYWFVDRVFFVGSG